MKQQIITIIEKEEYLKDMDHSQLVICKNYLQTDFTFIVNYKGEEAKIKANNDFVTGLEKELIKVNHLLIASDSDITNFKNNLITLINNYFK